MTLNDRFIYCTLCTLSELLVSSVYVIVVGESTLISAYHSPVGQQLIYKAPQCDIVFAHTLHYVAQVEWRHDARFDVHCELCMLNIYLIDICRT